MNTPILTKYKLDTTGKDPENLIGGERHTVAAGPKNKIFAAYEGPFFSNTAKVRLVDGSYLEPWVDFQPVHHFPEASKKTGQSCTCFIKILNESVSGDVFLEYQVVGGDYTFNSVTLENLLWAIINDERSVLWDNINNKPATYPPSYHIHDIFTDTYGWDDRIAFSNWVSDYLIGGAEALDYVGFTNKVNVVLDELTTIQTSILAQIAAHDAEQDNPHADTRKKLGYTKLQNLATATGNQPVEGQRTDLRLTVKGAEDILSDAVEGYAVNLIHQGILPVSRFGNLNFLQPGIIGSFEGASMIEAFDRYAQMVEADGTFVRLRPGTNGESIALYYDYITNIHRNLTTPNLVNTNNKYRPAGLNQDYLPGRLFDCQGDILAGIMYRTSALPATTDYKVFVAITNSTLDSTKHNCAEISNPTFTYDDGSTGTIKTGWTAFCLVGDRIYVVHHKETINSAIENGVIANGENNIVQIYIGYILVADVINNASVTMTQITGWSTTFLGQTRTAARSLKICDQNIGKSSQHVLVRYDGNAFARAQYRSWSNMQTKIAANADGTLTLTTDFTLNVDSKINTNVLQFPFRLQLNLANKTATMLDNLRPFVIVDSAGGTLTATVNTNNSKLNLRNWRGSAYDETALGADYHGSRFISKKGYSITTGRSNSANVGLGVVIQSITGFTTEQEYWKNPAAFPVAVITNKPDPTQYGSAARGNLRAPILFPNNRVGFYTSDANFSSRYVTQPLIGDGTYSYKLVGVGTLPGYQPSNDRTAPTKAEPDRDIITEINGSNVVTHCRCISEEVPTGVANVDYLLNTTGAISTDLAYLKAQKQRLLTQAGITATDSTSSLWVPTDAGMPLLLKVTGYTPVNPTTGITTAFTMVASVTYAGTRDGVLSGWVANVDDLIVKSQEVGTTGLIRRPKVVGMISYKVGNEYIIALGGSQCLVTLGPANNQMMLYIKSTNGRISGNASRFDFVAPYDDLLTNSPFALPGKGFFITYSDTNYNIPVGPDTQAAQGPCAIVLAQQGESYDALMNWGITGKTASVLISQTVEQGWILYFAEEIPVILNGREYTMAITSVDLRNIKASPGNTTYYVYIEVVDALTAKYTVSATELAATTTRMYIGQVVTNSSQINTINITKRSGINKYQISATKMGSSIPVSTGLPFQSGNWSQE
ncbi:hypothetical protein AH06_18 [Erwinia phage AH06]|nr:hypothetical protein AH06_18 [Erwinia phage AH06]